MRRRLICRHTNLPACSKPIARCGTSTALPSWNSASAMLCAIRSCNESSRRMKNIAERGNEVEFGTREIGKGDLQGSREADFSIYWDSCLPGFLIRILFSEFLSSKLKTLLIQNRQRACKINSR